MAAWRNFFGFNKYAGGMKQQVTEHELKLAEKVAWRIGSKWTAVEIDDLQQHLFLWLVENWRTLERWRNEPGDNGKLYVSLRREAAKFCAKEQAASVGRPLYDEFYTPELLRRALPFIFEDTPVTSVNVNPGTGQPVQVPNESNLALTIITDIRQAFWGLNPEVRQVLIWRFQDGLSLEEVGELRGISKDGAKKAVDRAIHRLADSLAGNRL